MVFAIIQSNSAQIIEQCIVRVLYRYTVPSSPKGITLFEFLLPKLIGVRGQVQEFDDDGRPPRPTAHEIL